jgi:FtsH-binding integral membrane protein
VDTRRDHSGFTREELGEERAYQSESYSPQVTYTGAPARVEMIQETYRLLAVAVFCAMAGCWMATQSLGLMKMLVSPVGLIASLFAINIIPSIARGAMGSNRWTGTVVLALDGALSGIVISPLVFVASLYGSGLVANSSGDAPNLVQQALVITGFAFAGVTAYVHMAKSKFDWAGGMMGGLFFTALGLMTLGMLFPSSGVSYALMGVVGILGILQLLYGTSKVLNDPQYNDPISGALILYAGLFNTFQVILNLLLSFGRSRD